VRHTLGVDKLNSTYKTAHVKISVHIKSMTKGEFSELIRNERISLSLVILVEYLKYN